LKKFQIRRSENIFEKASVYARVQNTKELILRSSKTLSETAVMEKIPE